MARSSRTRTQTNKPKRKPLTREMLLPLPVAKVRAMSLENHLALVAMRGGHGSMDQMICLLKVVYLAWFLSEAGMERGEIEVFRAAEATLACSVTRAEQAEGWSLSDADHRILERVLALYDRQTASVPAHLFEAAWQRLQHFICGDSVSALPAPRA